MEIYKKEAKLNDENFKELIGVKKSHLTLW